MKTRVFRRSLTADPSVPISTDVRQTSQPHDEPKDVQSPVEKLPLALRKLQTFNKPGLKETEIPMSNQRTTRQSSTSHKA